MNSLKDIIQVQFGINRLKTAKVLTSNGKYLTIDAPSLIIPYYDESNNLIGLQTRYLGKIIQIFTYQDLKEYVAHRLDYITSQFWNQCNMVQDFLLLRA